MDAAITEATGRLGEIVTASKAYAQEHLDSTAPHHPTWPPATGGDLVDLSPTENFTYAIESGGGADAETTPLVITATGTGKMLGSSVTVTLPNIWSYHEVTARTGK